MDCREGGCALLTQTQSLDDGTVAIDVASLQVVQQSAALADQAGQGTLGAVVLAVLLHVLSQVADAVAEECNLALGTSRVGRALANFSKSSDFLAESKYIIV